MRFLFNCLAIPFAFTIVAHAEDAKFAIQDQGGYFTIAEGGRPALVCQYAVPPDVTDDDADTALAFLGPIYDIHGNPVVPPGGLRWGWESCKIGGRDYNLLQGEGLHKAFERFTDVSIQPDRAEFTIVSAWVQTDNGAAVAIERARVTLWPTDDRNRTIDLNVNVRNVGSEPMALSPGGADHVGGVFVAVDDTLGPVSIGTPEEFVEAGEVDTITPWIDLSYRMPRSSRYLGIALLQPPQAVAPIRAARGAAGTRWPATGEHILVPGAAVDIAYRLVLHGGYGEHRELGAIYDAYVASLDATAQRGPVVLSAP